MNEKRMLRRIIEDCPDGYGVFELDELCMAVPKLSLNQVKSLLKHLETVGYINIKYCDEKAYCLAPLPKAKQVFEEKQGKIAWKYIVLFLCAFFGGMIGSFVANIF